MAQVDTRGTTAFAIVRSKTFQRGMFEKLMGDWSELPPGEAFRYEYGRLFSAETGIYHLATKEDQQFAAEKLIQMLASGSISARSEQEPKQTQAQRREATAKLTLAELGL